jgi:hypothetical protein
MSPGLDPGAAIQRALDFLDRRQLPSGEVDIVNSEDRSMASGCVRDPSIFPAALVGHALSFAPSSEPIRRRAARFLAGQADAFGLWRHWTREHPRHGEIPQDLDDTACSSAVLAGLGVAFPDNLEVILANRRSDGLFYTWVTGRAAPNPSLAYWRVVLAQIPSSLRHMGFFRITAAEPNDVDGVVNANVLFHLGRRAETEPVIEHLLALLREKRELDCDKWYDNPFVIWYFFSRALGPHAPQAGDLIEARLAQTQPRSALDVALAICCRHYGRREPSHALVDQLLRTQLPGGEWPRAATYKGAGVVWGSEEVTTAFAVEALARLGRPQ